MTPRFQTFKNDRIVTGQIRTDFFDGTKSASDGTLHGGGPVESPAIARFKMAVRCVERNRYTSGVGEKTASKTVVVFA